MNPAKNKIITAVDKNASLERFSTPNGQNQIEKYYEDRNQPTTTVTDDSDRFKYYPYLDDSIVSKAWV